MKPSRADLFADAKTMLTIAEASKWASDKVGRHVTSSNISYLVKYGRIATIKHNGTTLIDVAELEKYYQRQAKNAEAFYATATGENLNWKLSFREYKEAETTKHIHRLHPYKGKFIPQLVAYFLDNHTDELKRETYFAPNDIVLDPFCGSGTTLIQANELNMHAIGIDISLFNTMMSNLKLSKISLAELAQAVAQVSDHIAANKVSQNARAFEADLLRELKLYNDRFFPAPKFRQQVRAGDIDEKTYTSEKVNQFRPVFERLCAEYNIDTITGSDAQTFLNYWYLPAVKAEIMSAKAAIDSIENDALRSILQLILSRTMRSSRATTHSSLATLNSPVTQTYYCRKHNKICKPLFSMLGWWQRYGEDTMRRVRQFADLRTDTMQNCLTGDSRNIDIFAALANANPRFAKLAKQQKIQGIFSSPPYVGMIDYHEQHAYAYELFDLPRNDALEIGPLRRGRGKQAQEDYVEGIAQVLRNCQPYMTPQAHIFLVSNDRFNLYPRIAERAGLVIKKEYKRPVLNRSEGDKSAYAETIFHMQRP